MSNYTLDTHIHRLVQMFKDVEMNEMSFSCPATKDFYVLGKPLMEFTDDEEACRICRAFVGIPTEAELCPCDFFKTPSIATMVTKIKLKEAGVA